MRIKILLFFLITSTLVGQEISPILKFLPKNYNAENQNWAITQNKDKFIFVANNEGLLEYNGGRWKLYKSPNNSVMRSLLSVDDRIYSGAYMEFGFWKTNKLGALKYTSLSSKIENELVEDENIWNIKKIDKWVLFQSFHRIYFYNSETEEISYRSDFDNYYRIFEIDNNIYIFKNNRQFVHLQNDEEKVVTVFPNEFGVKLVLSVFKTTRGFMFLTRHKGIFTLEDNVLKKWKPSVKIGLSNYQFFCGIQLKDNTFVLGTVSNGIIRVSENGEIINKIDQTKGLSNNTVLKLFEDADGNVWSALDNGINCLNVKSYVKEFNDNNGFFGSTYCSINYNGKLYIGTNQGLFYKSINKNEPLKKIKGTEGQVWSLVNINGDLFCGHTAGTLLIKKDVAFKITSFSGTWGIKEIPNEPNLLLQGHYAGMSILEKVNNKWKLRNRIKGFQSSARFFELFNKDTVFVNHEYKGVYRLILSNDYTSFIENKLLSSVGKGKGSGLIKYNDKLLYSHKDGILRLNANHKLAQKDSVLNILFSRDEYISGKLILDKKNRLWSFNKSTISYLEKGPIKNKFSVKFIQIKNNLRKTTISFENISNIYKNTYLIGKTNGYLLLDLDEKPDFSHTIFLNEVNVKNVDAVDVSTSGYKIFRNNENSLNFKFSSPIYNKYEFVNYQYKLNDNNWVDLENKSEVTFDNLSFGDYNLSIRSKVGNRVSDNTIFYQFEIKPPIYLSSLAIVFYVLFFLFLIFIIHKLYKKYYKKQHLKIIEDNARQLELQKIQTDREVIRLKNEKLSQEVESKNRELAISTMSIVKRNEFLRGIRKELKKIPEIKEENEVFKLIDENLNSNKDWNFFKEAFNNVDKEFLKRAKKLHPELTNSNLKFCAYLRLNLSSKEIAPLLNISVKSVEIRRYRLRKKLNLPQETHLIDYILNI
ncbi:LuxR C-terminal-related transcriptional regulator [Polaribacter sp. L3A8]|uniref:LuxR C-terminal-related transcriptional regulator n=1 Tax=Polaribacter sp. L3A8 TaxID=2686361 RepID=UPI00131BBD46|nr:LuxR C-terminal-related transcriptional regulator [Polaribacter sp. L3A8]